MRTVFSTNDTFPGVILSWVSSLSLGVILSMSRAVRESCDCSSVAACRARCARDANAAPRCACESNVRIITAKDLIRS